jgi:hypothetical protein
VEPVADIEIDIFSGQPNPRVELRGQAAKRLSDLLEHKRQRSQVSNFSANLGFRGFLVRLESSKNVTYRVLGDTLIKGADAFSDPNGEAQEYIMSVLPSAMKRLVEPFLGSDQHNP